MFWDTKGIFREILKWVSSVDIWVLSTINGAIQLKSIGVPKASSALTDATRLVLLLPPLPANLSMALAFLCINDTDFPIQYKE